MANVARAEGERAEDKLHFLDYWRVVKKRKEIIVATLVIIVLSVTVISWITKPTYSAYSQIKIEQRQRPVDVFGTERTTSLLFDQWEFETHIKALEADPVLEKVVKGEIYGEEYWWSCPVDRQVRLTDAQASAQDYVCSVCGGDLRQLRTKKYPDWVPLNEKWAKEDGYPSPYTVLGAIGRLKRELKIRAEKGTRLITIRYESHDKEEAKKVADMVAEAYIQWRDENREASLRNALNVLKREQRVRSRDLNTAVADLVKMRRKFRLDKQDQPIQYQRREQYMQERDLVRGEIAKLEAYVQRLSAMTAEERINATQDNPAVYQLAAELARQEASRKASLEEYGAEHPEVRRQKEAITTVKQRLYGLADGVLESKKVNLAALQDQEKKLDGFVKDLDEEIRESQEALEEYERTKKDVELMTVTLLKMEESRIMEETTNAIPREDILLHQPAQLPASPVKPKKIFNVIVSIFVGLTLGTGLAYFVDYLDTSIKNVDDLERYLGMSMLAVIPKQTSGLLINENPKSHAAENYRMLWTSIQFERREDRFKNLMITSGGATEGKTTTVVNLGIAAAQMDAKVLLVDSDLRRPKIHKLLRYPNNIGLSDVLLKDVDPREVIVETGIHNLWAMPSGKLPSNVIGLLSSQKMREAIATLSQDYDIVLYDSPPVIGVSDASVLANVVDRVLLVIDYKKYPKGFARRARKSLENVGGQLLGVVINNLNIREEGYYYYGYGYGKAYHHYYYRRYGEERESDEEEKPAEKEKELVAGGASTRGAEQGTPEA